GPGWRIALTNIRVQKNRHLGSAWWQTPQSGGFEIQFFDVLPLRERIVSVVLPDGETHRFRAGALVKNRPGDPDYSAFAVLVRRGRYRFYPIGDTTSRLEPLDGANQLADEFWIHGTGDQDLMTGDIADPDAEVYNPTRFRLTLVDGTSYRVDVIIGLLEFRDLNNNSPI